ncbi:PRC-barrel domain-containing protein [Delftia acidovorans]
MKNQHSHHFLAVLALAAVLASAATARAQIAGSTTTMDVKTSQTTSAAVGWSAKKSLIGKFIFNDTGGKVGRVDDLIISLDKNVTYAIVSAGGFVGIGQHDVAIPIREINEISGKLIIMGATKQSVKDMPAFTYTNEAMVREQFLANAGKEISKGKAAVSELEKKYDLASSDAKVNIQMHINRMHTEIKSADEKINEMRHSGVKNWRDFEAGVVAAIDRIKKIHGIIRRLIKLNGNLFHTREAMKIITTSHTTTRCRILLGAPRVDEKMPMKSFHYRTHPERHEPLT